MDSGHNRRFISIEHVSKRFESQGRRFEALRDVTLDLREREFIKDNREQATQIVAKGFRLDPKLTAEYMGMLAFNVNLDAKWVDALKRAGAWMLANKLIEREPEYASFIVPDLLETVAPASPRSSRRFNEMYRRRYGREIRDVPIEAVTFRVRVGSPPTRNDVPRWSQTAGHTPLRERRPVHFQGGWLRACPVYDRYALALGTTLRGPAVVEERESTTVVTPAATLKVDQDLNLVITLGGSRR